VFQVEVIVRAHGQFLHAGWRQLANSLSQPLLVHGVKVTAMGDAVAFQAAVACSE
jgi:hypothetical protein